MNLTFSLLRLLETYITREQDTVSEFFRHCYDYFFPSLRYREPPGLYANL